MQKLTGIITLLSLIRILSNVPVNELTCTFPLSFKSIKIHSLAAQFPNPRTDEYPQSFIPQTYVVQLINARVGKNKSLSSLTRMISNSVMQGLVGICTPLSFFHMLSNFLMQKLTRIFTLSSLSPVSSDTLSLLYFEVPIHFLLLNI